jgi:membrane protease YdiL (CAAX protease family)
MARLGTILLLITTGALVGLAVFGGYWIARAIAEPDAPWRGGSTTFAVLIACYLFGLALTAPSLFRGSK